jgi:hypothetical protein
MTTPHTAPLLRDDARAALALAAGVALSGLLVGVLWVLIAPRAMVEVRDDAVFLLDPEGPAFIAADGWFAVLGTVAGFLCAVVAFLRFRRHGPAALIGLTVGGLLAGVIAWRLGHLIGPGELAARAADVPDGTRLEAPVELRALGVLLAWPVAAVSWYFALTLGFEPVEPRGEATAAGQTGREPDDEPDAEYAA